MVGRTLGHYEILEPLGAGGMGEVYRARDTKLDRDVAIKVLPEEFAADVERLARFTREAKLLATLHHPNIAGVYGLEDDGVTRFIAMELVEGETLAERISRSGRIEVDEALEIARQIAEALGAAHGNGIIHRDLKPANVVVTADGQAKVLDFGLAKSSVSEGGDAREAPTHSPTATVATTEAGVLLGTAPYMSPEQAKGKELDKRTDIWAFGCVLFEMLTGKRPFQGENVTETLAAVLKEEPKWDLLPVDTPHLSSLLRRCLRKDPRRRLHDIADARIEIEDSGTRPPHESAPVPRSQGTGQPFSITAAAIAASVLAAVTGVGAWTLARMTVPSPQPMHFSLNLPDGYWLTGGNPLEARIGGDRPSRTAIAVSPIDNALVYAATNGETSSLFRHGLDGTPPTPIAGTEGGVDPFFSPDGRWVGFFADRAMKAVSVDGGNLRTIATNASGHSASWTTDAIVFNGPGGIHTVPEVGGTPTRITEDPERGEHDAPFMLSGSAAVLYTVERRSAPASDYEIVVKPPDEEPRVLVTGSDGRYVPTGHLLFARDGALMAAGFDPETLELTTDPVQVVGDVMLAVRGNNWNLNTSRAQYSIGSSGTLAYVAGGIYEERRVRPLWVRRGGGEDPIPSPLGDYFDPRLSPDDRRLAISRGSPGEEDILVVDPSTGAVVFEDLRPGTQQMPVWSADADRLAFLSDHDGFEGIYIRGADGDDEPDLLTAFNGSLSDWSADNMLLLVSRQGQDVQVMEARPGAEPQPFVGNENSAEIWPRFHPDGGWIAYASNRTGQYEVYVRRYPSGTPEISVTHDRGGRSPIWSRDGKSLVYRTLGLAALIVVAFEDDPDGPSFGEPVTITDKPYSAANPNFSFDVARDGRFVMIPEFEHTTQRIGSIEVVLNWFEELKERVPAGR